MHWFWRIVVAAIIGYFAQQGVNACFLTLVCGYSFEAYLNGIRQHFGVTMPLSLLTLAVPICVYLALPKRQTFEVAGVLETRCRKCGYILRGISEPRCPECGERI